MDSEIRFALSIFAMFMGLILLVCWLGHCVIWEDTKVKVVEVDSEYRDKS
jgi:hypothetical protein